MTDLTEKDPPCAEDATRKQQRLQQDAKDTGKPAKNEGRGHEPAAQAGRFSYVTGLPLPATGSVGRR
jgi:hypothetical protein